MVVNSYKDLDVRDQLIGSLANEGIIVKLNLMMNKLNFMMKKLNFE